MLTRPLTAYWIAFGPHGPRALDPPGESKSLFFHTCLVLVATLGIFATIRSFGGKAPESMTQEWQEQSNEYLKVCTITSPPTPPTLNANLANPRVPPGTTLRAPHRLLLGHLQGPRHGPVSPQGRLSSSSAARLATSIISLVTLSSASSFPRRLFFSFVHRAKRSIGRKPFLSGKQSPHLPPPLGHRVKKERLLAILEAATVCLLSGGVTIEAAFV